MIGRFQRVLGRLGAVATLAACSGAPDGGGGALRVAAAANAGPAAEALARAFEARTGIAVVVSTGSTGQLYAQIRNGAPYDVFLAADAERPRRLVEGGLALSDTRLAYAEGRLVLYAPGAGAAWAGADELTIPAVEHFALANPRTAPYGAAAQQVLARLDPGDTLRPRLVVGENVAQTLQFVRSGAAGAGFIALAQVAGEPASSYRIVPDSLHATLRQEAVVLAAAPRVGDAREFLRFLRSSEAARILRARGYRVTGRDPE